MIGFSKYLYKKAEAEITSRVFSLVATIQTVCIPKSVSSVSQQPFLKYPVNGLSTQVINGSPNIFLLIVQLLYFHSISRNKSIN